MKNRDSGEFDWRGITISMEPVPFFLKLIAEMLVLPQRDNSLVLVRQTDHAAHSAQLAEAWCRPSALPPKAWFHLIEAVRHHDDGWRAVEHRPALDPFGKPYDFKNLPSDQHTAIWRRGIDLAQRQHFYEALLVAQHARSVHTRYPKPGDPQAQQKFIDKLTGRLANYLDTLKDGCDWERTGVEPHHLFTAQRLVSFFDAFSLALLGGLAWFDCSPTVRFGDNEAQLSLLRGHANSGVAHVRPWPFHTATVLMRSTSIELNRSKFVDSDELATVCQTVKPAQLACRLEPAMA